MIFVTGDSLHFAGMYGKVCLVTCDLTHAWSSWFKRAALAKQAATNIEQLKMQCSRSSSSGYIVLKIEVMNKGRKRIRGLRQG
jgi:hypothetical protein